MQVGLAFCGNPVGAHCETFSPDPHLRFWMGRQILYPV